MLDILKLQHAINFIQLTFNQLNWNCYNNNFNSCSTYDQFVKRGELLTNKVIKQEYEQSRLKS